MQKHILGCLIATAVLAGCVGEERSDAVKAVFTDRERTAFEIPEPDRAALLGILGRKADRVVGVGAPLNPPLGSITIEGDGPARTYDFHGRFVMLRPTATADGGVWEDPLFVKWDARYRAAKYHVEAAQFAPADAAK